MPLPSSRPALGRAKRNRAVSLARRCGREAAAIVSASREQMPAGPTFAARPGKHVEKAPWKVLLTVVVWDSQDRQGMK